MGKAALLQTAGSVGQGNPQVLPLLNDLITWQGDERGLPDLLLTTRYSGPR